MQSVKDQKKLQTLIFSLLTAASLSSFNPVGAQQLTTAQMDDISRSRAMEPTPVLPFQVFRLPESANQVNTGKLQTEVLVKINQALSRGSISPAEAASLKDKLNSWTSGESWYKSLNVQLPPSVVQENERRINEMSAYLDQKHSPTTAPSPNVIVSHKDIDSLISSALAHNSITSWQAEQYYSDLAQIESDLQTLSADPSSQPADLAAVHQKLAKLEGAVKTGTKI